VFKAYVFNVLVALDQLLNALRGGDPDETLSSVAAKNPDKWGWKPLRWVVERLDPGHLARSLEADEGKDKLR